MVSQPKVFRGKHYTKQEFLEAAKEAADDYYSVKDVRVVKKASNKAPGVYEALLVQRTTPRGYSKALETKDFLYYVNDYGDVVLYRKSPSGRELIADGAMAGNEYTKDVVVAFKKGDYKFLSENARYDAEQTIEEMSESPDDQKELEEWLNE